MIDNKQHTNSYKLLVLGIGLFLTACSSYDIEKEQETETVIQSENVQQKPNQELIVIESS